MKRPVGVTIIAVLAIIAAVVYLLGSLPFFGIGGVFASLTGSSVATLAGGLGIGIGVMALLLGVVDLVFGIGALQLKSWAWTLGVVLFSVSAVFSIVTLLVGGLSWSAAIGALLAIGILAYLFTAEVRMAFGHEAHTSSSSHAPSMTA